MASFYPSSRRVVDCIKRICFSGWNPPPGNRKLQGDIFYLEIETLENQILHITSCPDGFYVNDTQGSKFSASINRKFGSHNTLAALLSQVN